MGIFGEIRKEVSGSVYSDNVLNFKLPDSYIPSVYTLLFNSKYYFEFIDRLARGSVQQRLNQETLKELSIPIIDYKKQQQIAKLIEESFALKKQSEHLLEVAKRAVEIAIEESEAIALAYLHTHTANDDVY
ncbi:MAG: restriction endonuclease subunit S [Mariprofundaceae bacterium]|nr:restriction endonuclease subunit S [Mariprofundaceae bacterium]